MKLKIIYLVLTLLFIPGYIFYTPVINYIYNFNKITYSLNIPENSIETDSGGSNKSRSKTDTKYIIASIQHRFTMQDGEFQYAQDIGLIRDGTE